MSRGQSLKSAVWVIAAALFLGAAGVADDQNEQVEKKKEKRQRQDAGAEVVVDQSYRLSKINGMDVKNPEGEDLGSIEDLVLDLESGKVRYAAVSFGGFLGFGDKLFAVPMKALTLKHEQDESFFVLDVDRERLKTAPGFNKDAWPDFASPAWGSEVDEFYGIAGEAGDSHRGKVVSIANGKLTMTDDQGENRHSHNIGPNVEIVLDGDSADLKDLKQGHHVTVTTAEHDGKSVVVSIAARSTATRQE